MFAPIALALALGVAPPAPATAGFLDAAQLLALCRAEDADPATRHALCLGYVAGVTDQMLTRNSRPLLRRNLCVPKDASIDALAAAVLRWLSGRRDLEGLTAAGAVRAALQAEFPCGAASGR